VCAILFGERGDIHVLPGYPFIKLRKDSAEIFEKNINKLYKVHSEDDKYKLPVFNDFCENPVVLKGIYVLGTSNNDHVEMETVQGAEKFSALLENTYRGSILIGLERTEQHFKRCAKISKKIGIKRVIRPDKIFCIDEVVDCLEGDFLSDFNT
jgi:hypothetical protein